MTPAIRQLRQACVSFGLREYAHDPRAQSYGMEAAEILGVPPASVFKTLLAKLDGTRLVVGIVPVSGKLNLKALARAVGGKQAEMAATAEAQRSSGYRVGGISPFGQKKQLTTVLDDSALAQETIHVSGGRRGLEIAIAPRDLLQILSATSAPIGQP